MREKKQMNKKNIKFKVNNVIVVAIVLCVAVLLNIIATLAEDNIPSLKLDLTHDAITKLTNETKEFLAKTDEGENEIEIIYLKGTNAVTEETDTVLQQYDAYCDAVKYSVENYHKNPLVLSPFGIDSSRVTEGTVVVTNKDKTRYRAIAPSEMWSGAEFLLESRVTNAIAYVTNSDTVNVCVAVGYESDNNYLNLIQTMLDDNVTVSKVNLIDDNAYIPSQVDVLMLLVPYRDLDVKEIYKIDDYIQRGGTAVVALPFAMELENLESYLASWGVSVNNDVIYELDPNLSYSDTGVAFYLQKGEGDITGDISENIIASYVRSMNYTKTGDIVCETLLSSSAKSVATPPVDANKVTEKDIKYGPFSVAYLLEKPVGNSWDETGKLLVTTTPSIWGVEGLDGVLSEIKFGNRKFVSNALKKLSEKDVNSVVVPRKLATENVMDISDLQSAVIRIVLCVLLPLAVLLFGLVVWLKRRNK